MLQSLLIFLSKSRTLWLTFAATLMLTLVFGVVMHVWKFHIIDEMFNAGQITDHIAAMSPEQRHVHAWLTGTIDVAYPFAYSAFFIGVAVRSFGLNGVLLSIPSVLVIPADLLEGGAQIMLLTGHEGFMPLKLIMTPTKLLLFGSGLVITLAGLLNLLRNRFFKS
jgi:hypothetical protein